MQGPDGPQGPQGPQGEQGLPGLDGAPGADAEPAEVAAALAVDQDFTLAVADALPSLSRGPLETYRVTDSGEIVGKLLSIYIDSDEDYSGAYSDSYTYRMTWHEVWVYVLTTGTTVFYVTDKPYRVIDAYEVSCGQVAGYIRTPNATWLGYTPPAQSVCFEATDNDAYIRYTANPMSEGSSPSLYKIDRVRTVYVAQDTSSFRKWRVIERTYLGDIPEGTNTTTLPESP